MDSPVIIDTDEDTDVESVVSHLDIEEIDPVTYFDIYGRDTEEMDVCEYDYNNFGSAQQPSANNEPYISQSEERIWENLEAMFDGELDKTAENSELELATPTTFFHILAMRDMPSHYMSLEDLDRRIYENYVDEGAEGNSRGPGGNFPPEQMAPYGGGPVFKGPSDIQNLNLMDFDVFPPDGRNLNDLQMLLFELSSVVSGALSWGF